MRVLSVLFSVAATGNAISAQVSTHQVQATDAQEFSEDILTTNATAAVEEVEASKTTEQADEVQAAKTTEVVDEVQTSNTTAEVAAENIDVAVAGLNETANETALFEEEMKKDKLHLSEKHARRAKRAARRKARFVEESDNATAMVEEDIKVEENATAFDADEEVRKDKERLHKRFAKRASKSKKSQLLEANSTEEPAAEFLEDNATEVFDVKSELKSKRRKTRSLSAGGRMGRVPRMSRGPRGGRMSRGPRGGRMIRGSRGGRMGRAPRGGRMGRSRPL